MIEKSAHEMMTAEQLLVFEATKEMSFSLGVARIGKFRIKLFRQRSSIAIVVPYILGNI